MRRETLKKRTCRLNRPFIAQHAERLVERLHSALQVVLAMDARRGTARPGEDFYAVDQHAEPEFRDEIAVRFLQDAIVVLAGGNVGGCDVEPVGIGEDMETGE